MLEGGTSSAQPAGRAVDWRLAGEWLQSGQYEQVAAVLQAAQEHCAQSGDALRAHILNAARRLCLACKQCQEEIEWRRQAHQEAEQRELELKEQLHEILDLIGTDQVSNIRLSVIEPSGSMKRPGLWQRIQTLFGQKPPSPSRRPRSPETLSQATVQSSTDSADLLLDLPFTSGAATQSPSSAQEPGGQQAAPSLVVYCLGAFRVLQHDEPIASWNGQKGKSIFKYLLVHREAPVAKDILMELFWSDADPEAARRNLHQAVYSLRQTLRKGDPDFAHVHFENDGYMLNPELSIWVDSVEFEEHARAGKRLEAADRMAEAIAAYGIAESLYQGDYLEEDLYEDWPTAMRAELRRTYCDLTDRLSEHYYHNDEYNAAIALCHKILSYDNCYEPAHRRLMCCYLAQGQRYLAVRQYQTCVATLQEELELGPSEETEALYQRMTTPGRAQR
jgi:DNA-binding SARP family transcriptional activator